MDSTEANNTSNASTAETITTSMIIAELLKKLGVSTLQIARGGALGLCLLLSGDTRQQDSAEDTESSENEKTEEETEESSIGDRWEDFKKNPDDWQKIDSKKDPRQPKAGESVRELWENTKTGERLGIHRKTPKGKTPHPHPFPPKNF